MCLVIVWPQFHIKAKRQDNTLIILSTVYSPNNAKLHKSIHICIFTTIHGLTLYHTIPTFNDLEKEAF